jgi:hypothetical protein
MAQQVGSLQITHDLEFQQREWRVQRAAWGLGLLILIAGLLGLLGGGPLSHVATASGPVTVEYERFVRKRAPTAMTLRIAPDAVAAGEVAVWLDRAFLDKVAVERVSPEPASMAAGAGRVIYRFALVEPTGPAEVVFTLQPEEPGLARGRLGIVDGVELAFDQFIFP